MVETKTKSEIFGNASAALLTSAADVSTVVDAADGPLRSRRHRLLRVVGTPPCVIEGGAAG